MRNEFSSRLDAKVLKVYPRAESGGGDVCFVDKLWCRGTVGYSW